MMNRFNHNAHMTHNAAQAASYDVGLRNYMRGVFVYMGLGLLLTAIVSVVVASSASLMQIIFGNTLLRYAVIFAPIGMAIMLGVRQNKASVRECKMFFWSFAVVFGIGLAPIFYIFSMTQIMNVLFLTAGIFGLMAFFGFTTKMDLTSLGFFAMIALIGAVVAGLLNFFIFNNGMFATIISMVVVASCVLLTAYETQSLKNVYASNFDGTTKAKFAVLGALSLYLNFILIFRNLLYLLYGDE